MAPIRLTLFMTRDLTLRAWDEIGIFDREMSLYRRLQEKGVEIGIVTYGGKQEQEYASRLPDMRILCNRFGLPGRFYKRLLPWLHFPWLRDTDILKTNQINGGQFALAAARQWHKPLVARCGYLWSFIRKQDEGIDSLGASAALALEAEVFGAAQRVVVSTPAMEQDVIGRIESATGKTIVIPNFVDTELFCPGPKPVSKRSVLYVGRLSVEKNVQAVLQALAPLDIPLTVVGDGPERDVVEGFLPLFGGRLKWLARVPHAELPELMTQKGILVMPSIYEGHPKVLIEAMACGMAVIGADSPGIREIIQHGKNGWLCAPDAESLRVAVSHLAKNASLCEQLGRAARAFAVERYSLDVVVEKELAVINAVISEGKTC